MSEVAAEHTRLFRSELRGLLDDAVAVGELSSPDGGGVLAGGGRPAGAGGLDRLTATVLATYNGALITWALDGTGDLATWVSDHLDAVLAFHRPGPG